MSEQEHIRTRVLLPQPGESFLTDAGLETELVFHDGIELPCFASAVLLDRPEGRARLSRYYRSFVELAKANGTGVVLEAATWRLNPDWAAQLGYDAADQRRLNFAAMQLLQDLQHEYRASVPRFVVSGNLGPRYDGYVADKVMTDAEAEAYHGPQIRTLAEAGADTICAMTITTSHEAVGIAKAAQAAGMPAVISFTLETDGKLPSGEELGASIERVDAAAPGAVTYFGINCAHPTHFVPTLQAGGAWRERIGSVRANASKMSHAELDEAETLDAGDMVELAAGYADLQTLLPNLRVFGGCCGTDLHHIEHIAGRCLHAEHRRAS